MRRERRALRAIGALLALPAASADLRVIPEGYCAAPTIKQAAWVKRGEEFDGTMFAFGPFLTGETRDDGMAKGKCFIRTEAWQNYAECTTYCAEICPNPYVRWGLNEPDGTNPKNEEFPKPGDGTAACALAIFMNGHPSSDLGTTKDGEYNEFSKNFEGFEAPFMTDAACDEGQWPDDNWCVCEYDMTIKEKTPPSPPPITYECAALPDAQEGRTKPATLDDFHCYAQVAEVRWQLLEQRRVRPPRGGLEVPRAEARVTNRVGLALWHAAGRCGYNRGERRLVPRLEQQQRSHRRRGQRLNVEPIPPLSSARFSLRLVAQLTNPNSDGVTRCVRPPLRPAYRMWRHALGEGQRELRLQRALLVHVVVVGALGFCAALLGPAREWSAQDPAHALHSRQHCGHCPLYAPVPGVSRLGRS